MMASRILVTGAAGFIGFHLVRRLVADGHSVHGIDNLNTYYDPQLKNDRLAVLHTLPGFTFDRVDLADTQAITTIFETFKPDIVINLAAQAGVRYSIDHPDTYIQSNIVGFLNILEGCRHNNIKHLIFASSSSVYGGNVTYPFSEDDPVDHPVSLYAATKKSNELMAHTYAHLYNLPVTGLRFFTVYGPWGRPDMAYFKFIKAIFDGKPIDIYNNGDMRRDFTYIDDIIESIARLVPQAPVPTPDIDRTTLTPGASWAPYRICNIGRAEPEDLMEFVKILEEETGIGAIKNFLPMQAGDVKETHATVGTLTRITGYTPHVNLRDGIRSFVAWYRDYYKIGNGPDRL